MVMGSIIAITDQVLFKLSKVRLGSDGIIALKYGELLDSIFWNGMGSTYYLRKVKGFEQFCHFLRLVNMNLYKYVMKVSTRSLPIQYFPNKPFGIRERIE